MESWFALIEPRFRVRRKGSVAVVEIEPVEGADGYAEFPEERGSAKHTSVFLQPTNNLIVLRAKEYIERNYHNKLTLKDMADELYISPNYLSDLFKKSTGMKFSDYITEVRLEKAKEYLMNVHYKVGDISALVGFSDARYFSSLFRKKYGTTPLEFRNRYAGEQGQPEA